MPGTKSICRGVPSAHCRGRILEFFRYVRTVSINTISALERNLFFLDMRFTSLTPKIEVTSTTRKEIFALGTQMSWTIPENRKVDPLIGFSKVS